MRKDITKGGGAVGVIGIVLFVIGAMLYGTTVQYCESDWCISDRPYEEAGDALLSLGLVMAVIGGIVALVGAAMGEKPLPWSPCPKCQRPVNGRFCPYCGTRVRD